MSRDGLPGGNFDWIAPVYDALAFIVFGRTLQRAQTVFLDLIPAGASVLIMGGGTGSLLKPVLLQSLSSQTTPGASTVPADRQGHILYLEPSAGMLARASGRMVRQSVVGSVEFRLGNETALLPGEHFDVIITPFVLDLFQEKTLQTYLIPRLQTALCPGGLWLVTDFVKPPAWWQKSLLWTMIRFFRLTAGIETRQLADWQRLLADAGLTNLARRRQVRGMVSAEVWRLNPDRPTTR